MSTVVSKNVQIGADGTASNNFTAYQPSTPDGTLRIGNGNSGSVTDAIVLNSSGVVSFTNNPTLSGGTANGVTYLNGGKQVTSGSAFTFDGTTVGINTTIGNSTSLSITGDYTSNNVATFIGVQRIGGAVAGAWSYSDLLGSIQFGTTTNHSLVFLQNNAEAMRLTSTGLGIGTSLPAAKLHVEGTNAVMASTGLVTVQATTSGADVGGQITFQNNTARRAAIAGRQEASDAIAGYLQFGTRGTSGDITERMRIDSSGNVGIGTSSPNFTLQLDSQRADATFDANNLDTWADFKIQGQTASGNARGIYFDFDDDTENDRGAGIVGISGDATGGVGSLGFITTAGNTSAERMRIDSAGNLGLGVTPSAWRSSDTVFQVGPVASLNSDTDVTTDVGYNYFYNSSNIPIYSTTAQASRYSQYLGAHRFFTAPSGTAGNPITFTQAMTLTAAGNVGIGTSSPASRLHVTGTNGPLRISGTGYVLNPTEFTLGQYTSLRAYLQIPGGNSGQIEIWDGGTNTAVVFNAYGIGLYGSAGTSGAGVTFPSTQQASSNANTLDDYEEGTYNVTLTPVTGSITLQTSFASMSYTKVGRLVTVTGNPRILSVSSPTGGLALTLPFPVRNGTVTTSRAGSSIAYYDNSNGPLYFFSIPCAANETSTTLNIYVSSFSPAAVVPAADDELYVSFTYFTD
jgi:hypothetical protein